MNGLRKYYAGRQTNVSQSSAYLNHILTYVQHGLFRGLDNKMLEKLGAQITFFDGVPELFQYLKDGVLDDVDFRKHEITVEIYVVSTGLSRMIRGSNISSMIDAVWGCEFIEDVAPPGYLSGEQERLLPANGQINQIGSLIDDTTKTRPIFEINKGANNNANVDVNSQIPHKHRRVPFTNMIYVADGPSDIPVFSLLNQYGGHTYGVYQPKSEKHFQRVYNLRRQDRIEAYGPADYRDHTQTWLWIVETVRDIARRIVKDKEYALEASMQRPPGHLESLIPLSQSPLTPDGGLLGEDAPLM